jgi:glycosyltransferase involved in cell wall biosynthesis
VKVSIAIACYNQGHYLADAIESVLAQTRMAEELIVVDDGSRDNTAAVAARYPQVIYKWKKNGGLASARNAGLAHASGDRILFLDADDLLLPNAICDCLAAFEQGGAPAFVYGGYREIDADRTPRMEMRPEAQNDSFVRLLTGNYISMHGTVMYATAALRLAGGFDETLAACEDYDLYLRLAREHAFRSYPQIAAEYRRHDASMTRNNLLMIEMSRKVLRRQRRFARGRARRDYWAGLEFMTGFYAEAALEQTADHLRRHRYGEALRLIWGGLRRDPRFLPRSLKRAQLIVLNQLRGAQ